MQKNKEVELSTLNKSYKTNYEALIALMDLYAYLKDVKLGKIDSTSLYGETILNNFLNIFSNPENNIPYKNINILKYIKNLIIENELLEKHLCREKNKISIEYGIPDLKSKKIAYKAQDKLEMEKLQHEINLIINQNEKLKKILEYLKIYDMSKIKNIFLETTAIQDKEVRISWQDKFLSSKMPLMDRCEMLKNLILSTKDIEALDETFYNIFPGCCNEIKELVQAFRRKKKSFQQELLYMDKGLKLIWLLNRFDLIDVQNILVSNPKNSIKKQSILSFNFLDKISFNDVFYDLYQQLDIPQKVRDIDDVIIIQKINIEELSELIRTEKFKMTMKKAEAILRRVRKEMCTPERCQNSQYEYLFDDLCDALESHSYIGEQLINQIEQEKSVKNIEALHQKRQELTSILKGLKEIEDTTKVSEILTKIRTKKEYK